MSGKTIYEALRKAGLTKEGACAVMGNMQAESSMKANIAQRGMTKLSDAQYTAAADNGLIDFARDAVGYGLCQWTHHTRKAALLAMATNWGVSVGDEQMQVQYCLAELREDYPTLWTLLTSSHDLLQCTQRVCVDYERPAHNNVGTRYEYAQAFMQGAETNAGAGLAPPSDAGNDTSGGPRPAPTGVSAGVAMLQAAMQLDGYWPGRIDGIGSGEWREAFRDYAGDILGGK